MHHLLLLMFTGLLELTGAASVANLPTGLGHDDVRCDRTGCALGVCAARDLWIDPTSVIGQVRLVPRVANGKPDGFLLYAVRPGSPLQRMGVGKLTRREQEESIHARASVSDMP